MVSSYANVKDLESLKKSKLTTESVYPKVTSSWDPHIKVSFEMGIPRIKVMYENIYSNEVLVYKYQRSRIARK